MKRTSGIVAWLWAWSPLVTLSLGACFLAWLCTFVPRYADFRLRNADPMGQFTLYHEGIAHARQMLRALRHQGGPARPPAGLRALQLFVAEGAIAQLDSRLPESGFQPVPALLLCDGARHDVEVRYRGDFRLHWAFAKKSWRVQLRRNERWSGLRTFNLIAPKTGMQVNDHLGYVLARLLGLPAPRSELVWLWLNGRSHGLHDLVEQIDDGTMLRQGRTPGTVWAGELTGGDTWRGINPQVFDHPGLWRPVATDPTGLGDDRAPIQRLCALLDRPPDEAVHEALAGLVDLEAFGRLSALEVLVQYAHNDEAHNWRLYRDPFSGRLAPVLWDPNAWSGIEVVGPLHPISLDPDPTRLHQLLLENARFLLARHRALVAFLRGGGLEQFRSEARTALEAARSAAELDPNLRPPDPERVRALLAALEQNQARVFAAVEEAFLQGAPARWAPHEGAVRCLLRDRRPAAAVRVRLRQPVPADCRGVLRVLRPAGIVDLPVAVQVAMGGREVTFEVALLAQLRQAPCVVPPVFKVNGRRPADTTFDLRLEGRSLAGALEVALLRGPSGFEIAEAEQRLEAVPAADLFGIQATGRPAPEAWSGTVSVHGVREVLGDLRIEAGTRVLLGPDARLLVRGQLLARGSRERRISFLRERPDGEAWDRIELLGDAASGSHLGSCILRGGGGGSLPGSALQGMLVVREASVVRCEDCEFEGDSGDAQLLAVHARVELDRCRFTGARTDAVRAAQGELLLRQCHIARAQNSGVRLLGGEAVLQDTAVIHCGTGVRGEGGARLVAVAGSLRDCGTGLYAQDGAAAVARDLEFANNQLALGTALAQRLHGGPGGIAVHGGSFQGNRALAQTSPEHPIELHGHQLPAATALPRDLRVLPEPTPPARVPLRLQRMHGIAELAWSRAQ